MESTNLDELQGRQSRAAMTEGGPKFMKRIRKVFRKLCHHQRNLQIINHSGCTVNLMILDYNKEEISQLIMECKGNIKQVRS